MGPVLGFHRHHYRATFLITDHHQSRLRAWVFSAFSVIFFIALFIAVQVLFRCLGL